MRLLIYGAGNLGKELFDYAGEINSISCCWDEIAFLDEVKPEHNYYGSVIYRMSDIQEIASDQFEIIIATGEPANRKLMYQKIKKYDFKLATLIHPKAIISPTATIGEGCIVGAFSIISSDVVLKENVLIQPSVLIGHDSQICSHTVISSLSVVGGESTIGESVFIAFQSVIRQEVLIGDNTIVGMGAVVNKNLKSESIYAGNPARRISENFEHRVFV